MRNIIGHRNPDTDATCSSIAYQNFLKEKNIESQVFILDDLNNETKFILEKFEIEPPEAVSELPANSEVVLLDHNEKEQSIANINELNLVEIIDHHKVKVETEKPISILIKPLGSSCSIVAEKYFNENVNLNKNIAGILLAGIISDTLFFRSPTTTDKDKDIVEELNKIVGIDNLEKFSLEMFNAKSNLGDIDIEKLIKLDYKIFDFKDGKYGIGVMETTNVDYGFSRKDKIIKKLKEIKEKDNLEAVYFVIVDILNEKSFTLSSGESEKELFKKLFKATEKDGFLFVDKLVSRKKQIVPIFEQM